MSHFKKIVFFLFLGVLTLGASVFALELAFKEQGGIGSLSSSLEAIRLRSAHPTMKPAIIAREAEKANRGALGLAKTLATGNLGASAQMPNGTDALEEFDESLKQREEKDVYVRVAENREAILKAQFQNDRSNEAQVKGAVENLRPDSHQVALTRTGDGREVIGVVDEGGYGEFNAVERINALHIPNELKQKILANYYATGSLPEVLIKEKIQKEGAVRSPSSAPSSSLTTTPSP